MKVRFRSARDGNRLGVIMVFPTGQQIPAGDFLVPMDGDWRADVEFYDGVIKLYKIRLKKAFGEES